MDMMMIQRMMKDAQKMQKKMAEEMRELRLTGESGGGRVKVVINGEKIVQSVKIEPSVINADDAETLEDLIVLACRDAAEKADKILQEKVGGMAGGMKMPGMFS